MVVLVKVKGQTLNRTSIYFIEHLTLTFNITDLTLREKTLSKFYTDTNMNGLFLCLPFCQTFVISHAAKSNNPPYPYIYSHTLTRR